MSDFKLVVGEHCANGAKVISLFMNESEGIVLATWKSEFITWEFSTNQQDSTAHGNYFMYDSDTVGDAFYKAYADMINRIQRIIRSTGHD